MVKQANKNQEMLLSVLNKLFVYMIDPQTKKKVIRINPKLNEDSLQEIVLETRAIIINLYLKCEIDFVNGIKIYEAIVEKKILETTQNQIETLEKTTEGLISDDRSMSAPMPAEINELESIASNKIEKQQNIM
jgi:hypothetical protein